MLSLAAGVVLATLTSSELSQAWYSEVMLGRLAEAEFQYQSIYLEEANSWQTRARAALRAGGCAEKLGEAQKAIDIYAWLKHEGDPDDPMVRRARLRTEVLQAARRPPGGPPEPPIPVREAYLYDLKLTLGRRRGAVERVEKARGERDARDEIIEKLKSRLRAVGVQWWFERSVVRSETESESGEATAFVRDLGLNAEDEKMLKERLADAFYLRALRALRDRDFWAAVDALRIHEKLAETAREDVGALKRSAEGILDRATALQAGARERLENEYPRLRAKVSRRVSGGLEEAEKALREGDGDLSLDYLREMQRLEDWAPESLAVEGRLRDRILRSILTFEHHLSRPVYEEALEAQATNRRVASKLALQIEQFLARDRFGDHDASASPELEDPSTMLPVLRNEVQEVHTLLESEDQTLPDPPAFLGRLEDTLLLLDWFPELDPVRHTRRLILNRLGR